MFPRDDLGGLKLGPIHVIVLRDPLFLTMTLPLHARYGHAAIGTVRKLDVWGSSRL